MSNKFQINRKSMNSIFLLKNIRRSDVGEDEEGA